VIILPQEKVLDQTESLIARIITLQELFRLFPLSNTEYKINSEKRSLSRVIRHQTNIKNMRFRASHNIISNFKLHLTTTIPKKFMSTTSKKSPKST